MLAGSVITTIVFALLSACPSLILFFFLAMPDGVWDPSSLTRGGTCSPFVGSTEF